MKDCDLTFSLEYFLSGDLLLSPPVLAEYAYMCLCDFRDKTAVQMITTKGYKNIVALPQLCTETILEHIIFLYSQRADRHHHRSKN